MKSIRVKWWNTRESYISERFTSLVEAVRFMREREMQGYSTVLV